MGKALVVDLDKCTGCRSCELACSFKHFGEFNPVKSAVQVSIFTENAFYIPMVCFQCADPSCMAVCPTGALYVDTVNEAYVVKIDKHKCIGCKMCTLACPFGSIRSLAKQVHKCDLCDGEPECVTFCVPKALQFKDAEAAGLSKAKAYAEKIFAQKKEAE